MIINKLQRVVFENNPLVEVVGQVSFNRTITLEDQLPVDFQKQIKSKYPHFELLEPKRISLRISNVPEVVEEKAAKEYHFYSLDRKSRVSLTSTYIAYSTQSYKDWESFLPELESVLTIVKAIYDIELITRVGLRYKNLIVKENLGLADKSWDSLISESVLGFFTTKDLFTDAFNYSELIGSTSVGRVKLDFGELIFQSGFADKSMTNGKEGFYIDNDFFCQLNEPFEDLDLAREMEKLHANGFSTFRHCIKRDLFDALQPRAKS